jgi:hypothetical protein
LRGNIEGSTYGQDTKTPVPIAQGSVRVSTNSALDFSRERMGVKSSYEFLELSTAHVRKQFQTVAEQIHQLTRLKM